MRDTPHVLMGVRASGVPDSSQSCVAKNDSRGVFVNSTLRASSTKTPNIAKKNSFHAGDPNMMATSPMKTRISPNVCGSPGGYFKYFRGTYPKNLQHKFTLPSEVHNTVVPGKWAEKKAKGPKKLWFANTILYFQVICMFGRNAYVRLLSKTSERSSVALS